MLKYIFHLLHWCIVTKTIDRLKCSKISASRSFHAFIQQFKPRLRFIFVHLNSLSYHLQDYIMVLERAIILILKFYAFTSFD